MVDFVSLSTIVPSLLSVYYKSLSLPRSHTPPAIRTAWRLPADKSLLESRGASWGSYWDPVKDMPRASVAGAVKSGEGGGNNNNAASPTKRGSPRAAAPARVGDGAALAFAQQQGAYPALQQPPHMGAPAVSVGAAMSALGLGHREAMGSSDALVNALANAATVAAAAANGHGLAAGGGGAQQQGLPAASPAREQQQGERGEAEGRRSPALQQQQQRAASPAGAATPPPPPPSGGFAGGVVGSSPLGGMGLGAGGAAGAYVSPAGAGAASPAGAGGAAGAQQAVVPPRAPSPGGVGGGGVTASQQPPQGPFGGPGMLAAGAAAVPPAGGTQ